MNTVNAKEKNFVSAVVYLHNDGPRGVEFCQAVAAQLDAHFAQYELVAVDDACTGGTVEAAAKMVEELGGQVVKIVFLMELAGLKGREKLKGYDVSSVISYPGK